jgi:general secretion pathway protein H
LSSASCNDPTDRNQCGFTLLEIIIVLVIMGLALAVFAGHGPMRSARLDIDGTAREIAGSLRLARSRAIALDRSLTWVATPESFGAAGEPSHPVPPDVVLNGSREIGFAPDGSSTGGQLMLQGGERKVVIGVDWLTGAVRLAGNG